MENTRLETLKQLVAQNPGNSFTRYGLAMEYARMGELEQAVEEFRVILETNPDYVAAYFHGGQTLERLDRLEEAREYYRNGIDVATRVGDLHTRSELQNALDMLGD